MWFKSLYCKVFGHKWWLSTTTTEGNWIIKEYRCKRCGKIDIRKEYWHDLDEIPF